MIQANYCFIIDNITKLESSQLSLRASLEIIDIVKEGIRKVESPIGYEISAAFDKVLQKSPDMDCLRNINAVIMGQTRDVVNVERIQLENIPYYKFALITSVDAERTFSRFKSLLRENRTSFTFDNLSKTFFVMCNSDCNTEGL